LERFLDLGAAENGLSGLIGQGKCAKGLLGQKPIDLLGKAVRDPDIGLQRTAECMAFCGV
jgi:hypothetical protein